MRSRSTLPFRSSVGRRRRSCWEALWASERTSSAQRAWAHLRKAALATAGPSGKACRTGGHHGNPWRGPWSGGRCCQRGKAQRRACRGGGGLHAWHRLDGQERRGAVGRVGRAGLCFWHAGTGSGRGRLRVGKTFFRAVGGKGTAGFPTRRCSPKTEGGQYTPEAEDLQRRFLAGNLTPEARSQLGPAAADYARSYAETLDYSMQDPKALLDNPVAAWRVANQHMMEGRTLRLASPRSRTA